MKHLYSAVVIAFVLSFPALPGAAPDLSAQNQQPRAAERQEHLPSRDLGAYDVPRPDGGKDKVYYSIITPEEEAQSKKEEKEKMEKSLDLLRNIVIDGRR